MGLERDPFAYYRRALTGGDKLAFDSLMQRAEKHRDGKITTFKMGELVQGIDPMEALFLSVMLEHEKEILELRQRLISTTHE